MEEWQPIASAPTDEPIDIKAERWVFSGERLSVKVCLGCRWLDRVSVRNPAPRWSRVPVGWRPTHWRPSRPASTPTAPRRMEMSL